MGDNTAWPEDRKNTAISLVLQEVANGESLRAIFRDDLLDGLLPSRKTFNVWLADSTELSDRYSVCAQVREDDMFEECIEIADSRHNDTYKDSEGVVHVDQDIINRDKLRIATRQWALGKMRPKKYGDRAINENININKNYTATEEEVDADIKELEAEMAKAAKK